MSTDLNPIPIHLVRSRFFSLFYVLSFERPSVGRLGNMWEENAGIRRLSDVHCTLVSGSGLLDRYSVVGTRVSVRFSLTLSLSR